jgi:hypothetical protein
MFTDQIPAHTKNHIFPITATFFPSIKPRPKEEGKKSMCEIHIVSLKNLKERVASALVMELIPDKKLREILKKIFSKKTKIMAIGSGRGNKKTIAKTGSGHFFFSFSKDAFLASEISPDFIKENYHLIKLFLILALAEKKKEAIAIINWL